MSSARRIQVLPDAQAVVEHAADLIVSAHASLAQEGNLVSLFLSGGSTPEALYKLLAREPRRSLIDWSRLDLYFGDERCVAPESALSNYRMARESLIDHVPIPASQVFRMKGELDPTHAAAEYDRMLLERFLDDTPDIVLLGMGADGHTASLFARTPALGESSRLCVANRVERDDIPAGTSDRITLTFPFINRAKQIIVMVTGASKADAVQRVLEGPSDPDVPMQRVRAESGTLHWLMDVAAAGM